MRARDPRAAAQARHHDGLRHARPGRGDVDGRPRGPAERAAGSSRTRTPVELYETPANTFVARFIGTPPMNLLPLAAGARRRGDRRHRRPGGAAGATARAARSACGPSTSRSRSSAACRAVVAGGRVPRRRFARHLPARRRDRSPCASPGSVGLARRRHGVARRGRRARSTCSSADGARRRGSPSVATPQRCSRNAGGSVSSRGGDHVSSRSHPRAAARSSSRRSRAAPRSRRRRSRCRSTTRSPSAARSPRSSTASPPTSRRRTPGSS